MVVAEYYQLSAAISGLGYGEREVSVPSEQAALANLDRQLDQLRKELAAIDKAAREKILAARARGEAVASEPPRPLARWEFDNDLHDSIQQLRGTANGNARIEGGALILDGKSFVESAPVPTDIAEKTLEAWIQLDNLDQRGGAAISIGSLNGGIFDAIVFGERDPKQWMEGGRAADPLA